MSRRLIFGLLILLFALFGTIWGLTLNRDPLPGPAPSTAQRPAAPDAQADPPASETRSAAATITAKGSANGQADAPSEPPAPAPAQASPPDPAPPIAAPAPVVAAPVVMSAPQQPPAPPAPEAAPGATVVVPPPIVPPVTAAVIAPPRSDEANDPPQAVVHLTAPIPAQAAPVRSPIVQTPSVQAPPIQAAPAQAPPVQAPPIQVAPAPTPPVQAPPIQVAPAQSPPAQSPPAQAPPAQAPPVQTPVIQAAPVQSPPVQTSSASTVQVQATPVQAAPVQAAPVQAAPDQPVSAQTAAASPPPALAAVPPPPPAPRRIVPSFDVVRVSPDGMAVIAGRGEPGAVISITDGGREVGRATADARGEWVVILTASLAAGTRELALVSRGPGDMPEMRSDRVVVLSVPERAAQQSSGGTLAVSVPRDPSASEASRALQVPNVKPAAGGMALALESVDYDTVGNLVLGGRAPSGTSLQVYVDGRSVGRVTTDPDGRWQLTPDSQIAPGVYTLRVDQLAADGRVAQRIELPFSRAEPSQDLVSDPDKIVVQPGNSLWRIARRIYGEGMRYTVIYQANRVMIRDPDMIYPGQVFAVPPRN